MKIYTRTGDSGETGLFGGRRVAKDEPRIEVCGTIDELNCVLGLVRAEQPAEPIDALLERIQHELFEIGAEVAGAESAADTGHVKTLEDAIDRFDAPLEPLEGFILPGGGRTAAGLHLARAVCRRAERRLVTLIRQCEQDHDPNRKISPVATAYLNRLGDLLFVLARATCKA
jgi:cob(I)alamin adenosyltransferase